jgi:drug/metabolite transporter superfamily protein YnfA
MFALGILIGILSYLVFALSLLGWLKYEILFLVSIAWIILILIKIRNDFNFNCIRDFEYKEKFLLFLIILAVSVNLIGVLGPEVSFDALWYHLTLPDLYLQKGEIYHPKGELLHYSGFPQLIEMLYLLALGLGNALFAKIIHFLFGVGSSVILFKWLKKEINNLYALSGVVIFYTQLLVGWLSTTAYIDLGRTFFELLGIFAFWKWLDNSDRKWLLEAGVFIGLAASTKLLSFASMLVLALVVLKVSEENRFRNLVIFAFPALIIPLPWFIWNYTQTGFFLYPILDQELFQAQSVGLNLSQWLFSRTPWNLLKSIWNTAFTSGDILTPIYLFFFPLFLFYPAHKKKEKIMLSVFLLNLAIWFFIPLNYNRFLLPYTPLLIFLICKRVSAVQENNNKIKEIFFSTVLLVALINTGVRVIRNSRFIPYLIGRQTKKEFMKKNLDFSVGNFYDIDDWFENNITNDDKVLVVGVHNLFYLDFPYDHITWVSDDVYDQYNYLLVQNVETPNNFKSSNIVYSNKHTNVKVYNINR